MIQPKRWLELFVYAEAAQSLMTKQQQRCLAHQRPGTLENLPGQEHSWSSRRAKVLRQLSTAERDQFGSSAPSYIDSSTAPLAFCSLTSCPYFGQAFVDNSWVSLPFTLISYHPYPWGTR